MESTLRGGGNRGGRKDARLLTSRRRFRDLSLHCDYQEKKEKKETEEKKRRLLFSRRRNLSSPKEKANRIITRPSSEGGKSEKAGPQFGSGFFLFVRVGGGMRFSLVSWDARQRERREGVPVTHYYVIGRGGKADCAWRSSERGEGRGRAWERKKGGPPLE